MAQVIDIRPCAAAFIVLPITVAGPDDAEGAKTRQNLLWIRAD